MCTHPHLLSTIRNDVQKFLQNSGVMYTYENLPHILFVYFFHLLHVQDLNGATLSIGTELKADL